MLITEGKKPEIIIHYGDYVDDQTFLDENGNPYELIASKFPPKKQKEKRKIIVDRRTGKVKIQDPKFGWRII